MKVKLYCNVYDEGQSPTKSGNLYVKEIETGQAPGVGERISLYDYDSEDFDDGPMILVKERYWTANGDVCCDLQSILVNPTEQEWSVWSKGRPDYTAWYIQSMEKHPSVGMLAGGWSPWESKDR